MRSKIKTDKKVKPVNLKKKVLVKEKEIKPIKAEAPSIENLIAGDLVSFVGGAARMSDLICVFRYKDNGILHTVSEVDEDGNVTLSDGLKINKVQIIFIKR